jgi:DnaJ-class molecular chaperone
VTDFFALLNFPRSPWLEPDAVQSRFLELSAAGHPDRVHGQTPEILREANQRFSELNAAATCLRDTRDRLNHLLQLQFGAAQFANQTQSIPNAFVTLFGKIGQTCRDVDTFLHEKSKATSPMIQAQLFAKALDWNDRVAALQTEVADLRVTAESELKALSLNWASASPDETTWAKVRELAHVFAMIGRWESQLRERFSALAAA